MTDFRKLAEDSPDLLCLAGPDGVLRWVNRRWEQLLGWTPEELVGRAFIDFVEPQDVDSTEAALTSLHTGRQIVGLLNRIRTRDGEPQWLSWNMRRSSDGHISASGRESGDARPSARRVDFLHLAEHLGRIGHWHLDCRTQILFCSPEVYRIYGMPPDSSAPFEEQRFAGFHPDDRPEVERLVQRCIEHGEPYEFVARIRTVQGAWRHVRTIGRPEIDPKSGEVVELFGVIQDVTEPLELQAQLAHADKLKSLGTLVAGVAHEINNPLSYIKANAEVLAQTLPRAVGQDGDIGESAEVIQEIREGVARIQNIVGGLKSFARTSELATEEVELGQVVRTAERLCQSELRHRAQWASEIDPGGVYALGDESQLVQVAVNLILNAIQSIPEGQANQHHIAIRTAKTREERVFFEVQDTGVGMSDEVKQRAFDPFFTTKEHSAGTGLGLAICHGIVSRMGGSIEVSSSPGVGTRVRVCLPAIEPAGSSEQTSPVSLPPKATLVEPSALIVDDDLLVGRSLSRLLAGAYRVQHEANPLRALERLLGGWTPDVILCDVMMPQLSGPEFFERLVAGRPELARRVVFLTAGVIGQASEQKVLECAAPVVYKPVDRDRLLGVLQDLAQRPPD